MRQQKNRRATRAAARPPRKGQLGGDARVRPDRDAVADYPPAPAEARALDLAPTEAAEEEAPRAEAPRQINIIRRFGDWRTLLSFAVALAILALALGKAGVNWGAARETVARANPWLFALAFAVYYASFPLRAHRWRLLLHNANRGYLQHRIDRVPLWDLTRIVYLSYFANAVVPAKLGDVYRAYLARRWMGVSLSRTVGNILAERILDLMVLFPLLFVAAVLTFQAALLSAHASAIRLALVVGLGLAVLAGGVLAVIWRAGESVLRVLPHRLHDVYTHFRHGAVSSFGHDAPLLVGQTIVIWLLEGARFACVLAALGLLTVDGGKGVGLPAALFLALGSSVLTTLPLTPAGLGLVEPFIVGVLALLNVPGGVTTGAAVAVLERIVSYLSIAVFGFVLYLISDKARLTHAPDSTTVAAMRTA